MQSKKKKTELHVHQKVVQLQYRHVQKQTKPLQLLQKTL